MHRAKLLGNGKLCNYHGKVSQWRCLMHMFLFASVKLFNKLIDESSTNLFVFCDLLFYSLESYRKPKLVIFAPS